MYSQWLRKKKKVQERKIMGITLNNETLFRILYSIYSEYYNKTSQFIWEKIIF